MNFRVVARCDGPECLVEELATEVGTFPESWIVIKLERARDGLFWDTGRYGFHSLSCLVVWAANDVRYR